MRRQWAMEIATIKGGAREAPIMPLDITWQERVRRFDRRDAGQPHRLHQAILQGAVRAFDAARRELSKSLPDNAVVPAAYKLPTGEMVTVLTRGNRVAVNRGGINYLAFRIGAGIRYVPGLDLYVSGAESGGLHWLSLYEDFTAEVVKSAPGVP